MPRPTPPAGRTSTRNARQSRESLFEHATLLEFSSVINSSYDFRFILNHILLTIMGKLMSTRVAPAWRATLARASCRIRKAAVDCALSMTGSSAGKSTLRC